jgi:hypothetical protein
MAAIRVNLPMSKQVAGSSEVVHAPIKTPQGDHAFTDQAEAAQTNVYPLPDAVTVNVTSNAGGASTTVYVFNQDYLNNITSNGASAISYAWNDTFSGTVVSRLLGYARNGVGAIIYGVAIRMTVLSTGAGLPSSFTTINPYFLTYNAYGKQIGVYNLNTSTNQTRKDYDTSIQVDRFAVNLSRMSQFALTIPTNAVASCTFYLKPNFSV